MVFPTLYVGNTVTMATSSLRQRLMVGSAAALLLLGACSSGESNTKDNASQESTKATTTTSAPPREVEQYEGELDGFYAVPDPLPEGEPGELIRTTEVRRTDELVTLRVMYHSTDSAGSDRAATGLITYPVAKAPAGGWPVISTSHGTSGIASQCAPSRADQDAPGWGVEGVWAMTDYIGMGPIGELHPYLSKADEGNAVIDIVRAARNLKEANASKRWVSVGHSQGGHGALSAHELAGSYAPELELVSTVSLAPAAMLDRVYGAIDEIVTSILTMMAMYGGQTVQPELAIEDYFSPGALEASKGLETNCLDGITTEFIPIAAAGAFSADPRTTEPAKSFILANDVGGEAVDGVPLFLASGTIDDRVAIDRFRDLIDKVCDTGQVVELHIIEGADHNTVIDQVAPDFVRFINDSLDGKAPESSCSKSEEEITRPMS